MGKVLALKQTSGTQPLIARALPVKCDQISTQTEVSKSPSICELRSRQVAGGRRLANNHRLMGRLRLTDRDSASPVAFNWWQAHRQVPEHM